MRYPAIRPRALCRSEAVPIIVIWAPGAPDGGDTLEIVSGAVTVNRLLLLVAPHTVTATFPVVAPLGTLAWMLVSLQK